MKKLLFIMLLCTTAKAQDTTSVKRTEQYAELIAIPKMMSVKYNFTIDYGDKMSLWKDNRIKDDNGKVATFNSIADAMNYMNSIGWEFVNSYTISGGNGQAITFIFKRKIN